jgi:hypothetical protein
MDKLKSLSGNCILNYIILLIVVCLFQSCKVYQDPISLNDAANSSSKGIIKVTMLNGDEFIYDKIEVNDDNYFGINKKPNEIVETPLIKSEIKSIQKQNRKSSSLSNLIGAVVGIGSIVLGILML